MRVPESHSKGEQRAADDEIERAWDLIAPDLAAGFEWLRELADD